MIFDLILLFMIITALTRAKVKGCTEDLNFVIAFFFIVRLSGVFYKAVSGIFMKVTDSESLALVAAYVTLAIILYLIYNALVGHKIIELGKKVPKTTGLIMLYFFAALKSMIIFSVIFGLIYSHPTIREAKTGIVNNDTVEKTDGTGTVERKKPGKWITPKSYGMTYAFLGEGTGTLFQNLANYLTETVKTPVDFMAKQKAKQVHGSSKTFEAAQSVDGFHEMQEPVKKPAAEPAKKTEEVNK
jgi:hypothetical protein